MILFFHCWIMNKMFVFALLRLDPDGLHLVTGISLARIQLAQDTIGDKEIGEDSQPAAPGPLDPLVVRLLVRQ